MTKQDYYEVLGVPKTSDKKEIKKAYRTLAKKYHPDKNSEAGAEEKFKEAQEAYDILKDDEKRKAYDSYGHAGTQGFGGGGQGFNASGFGGFEDLNDVFGQFFGQGFGGFSANRGRGQRQGSDIEVTLEVPFKEAIFGTETTIKYKRKVPCKDCSNTGAKNGESIKTCATCGGRGAVAKVQNTFLGQIQTQVPCSECRGEGSIIEKKCDTCNAKGFKQELDEFTVKIPAGIPNGVTLRFQERGNSGGRGASTGSLYIHIEVLSGDTFERRGDDIYSEIKIAAPLATLGGEVEVETVHGDVILKIPAGTQPGKIFKLSSKGGPKFRGNGNGDQYIKTIVQIPTKLSKSEKKIWEQLT